ncbi:hypothetical protein EKE94_09185 [Mesobaculum littorinae]|uniref:Uncharacterized protein n=1 Tax=Mesobaculum littorinae TaxID=2486419 RepID=A0A438AK90_9RHOB|nr:hypothetical protein [Mesobaculum littorinae]RVV99035.1 hypothetical protein EKE94_09185 [Mesobaculum littorinae]
MKAISFLLAAGTLAACQTTETPTPTGNLENDMLPSAEVTAFEQVDQRLGYENARIRYDASNCAIYQATGPNGQGYSEPLRSASGDRICVDS